MKTKLLLMALSSLLFFSCKKDNVKQDQTPATQTKAVKVASAGTTWYVSAGSGNDNPAGGGINNPFKTINYALSKAVSGDLIYVRAGTYFEALDLNISNITVTNFPNESAIIDGTNSSSYQQVLISGDDIVFGGFEVRNVNKNGAVGSDGTGGRGVVVKGQGNNVRALKVHDTHIHGIQVLGNHNTVDNCTVYNCCLANKPAAGTTNSPYGTGGWPCAVWVGDNSTLPTYNTVRNTTAYNNYGEGIMSYNSDHPTFEDNISYDNWATNYYVSQTTYALCQRNLAYRSTNSQWPMTVTANFNIRDENTVNGTTKPYSAHNTVINNFLFGGTFHAFNETTTNNTGLRQDTIANNTLVNCRLLIKSGAVDGFNIVHQQTLIANNIITGTGSAITLTANASGSTGVTFSHNLWTDSGYPADAHGTGDVVGNPGLSLSGSTDAGLLQPAYFKLSSSTSPAVNKAIVLARVRTDFFNSSRGNSPDIGGHEF